MSGAETVRGWARGVRKFTDEWPHQGGAVLGTRVGVYLRRDTGGDGGFSHGRRLKAAFVEVKNVRPKQSDVYGRGSKVIWRILEGGTKPHVTRAGGRRGKGKLLRTPYGPRPFVNVSGIHARRTWSNGVDAGLIEAERSASEAWARVGRS